MNLDIISNQIYIVAVNEAKLQNHEFITPEHFLYSALMFDMGRTIIAEGGGEVSEIIKDLRAYLNSDIPTKTTSTPTESELLTRMFESAKDITLEIDEDKITLANLLVSIFELSKEECFATNLMINKKVDKLKIAKLVYRYDHKTGAEIDLEDDENIENSEYVEYGGNKDFQIFNDEDFKIFGNEDLKNSQNHQNANSQKFLNKYAPNLTEKAKANIFDPIIGRENILDRTFQILCRRFKNNPVYVGLSGVGKTSLVQGLAQKIANGEVPEKLKDSSVFHLDLGLIVAGTKYRGDFEERLLKVLDLISKEKNPIVYIDEIHQISGNANNSGNADVSSLIKQYFMEENIRFIGSTSHDEYQRVFCKNKSVASKFQKIDVDEPTIDEAILILDGIKNKYEQFHNVKYSSEVIRSACYLTDKYINDRYLPDKAIDVIDEAGAFLRLNSASEEVINVDVSDISDIVAKIALIPTESVSNDDKEKIKNLEQELKCVVFGQDKAIEDIVSAVKLSRAGLKDENKPIANLLFVGSTGVGKTEIANQLSKILGIKLLRFDMSEYQEEHTIGNLIGSPQGYIGHEKGGLLTNAVLKSPHCVLLLDEIEKAHPKILNVLLQVMDYGTLTDNDGRKINFKNIILIMTSNAGASEIGKSVIGFENKKLSSGEVDKAVSRIFSPEFRNRLDEVIVFNPLDFEMAENITKKAFKNLSKMLDEKNVRLKVSEDVIKHISKSGLTLDYGAREILRVINRDVKKIIAEEILFNERENKDIFLCLFENRIQIKQIK